MARQIDFVVGEYYHIYNRGVDKRNIVLDKKDLRHFLDSLLIFSIIEEEKQKAYNSDSLVQIVAYAILPNHYHLLLKEIVPNGISKFMQKLGTGYTMYFNEKYERSGALFQGRFKASHVLDPIKTSAYVNLNFIHHGIDLKKSLAKTSYLEYTEPESVKNPICNQDEIQKIIKMAKGKEKYKSEAAYWSRIFVDMHQNEKKFFL